MEGAASVGVGHGGSGRLNAGLVLYKGIFFFNELFKCISLQNVSLTRFQLML